MPSSDRKLKRRSRMGTPPPTDEEGKDDDGRDDGRRVSHTAPAFAKVVVMRCRTGRVQAIIKARAGDLLGPADRCRRFGKTDKK